MSKFLSVSYVFAFLFAPPTDVEVDEDGAIPLDHPHINFKMREVAKSDVYDHIEEWLRSDPGEGSWMVFLTDYVGEDGASIFAQLSIESSAVGVDHVLNIAGHFELEEAFRRYCEVNGHAILEREENEVRYLRFVTDVPGLEIRRILRAVYGVGDSEYMAVFGRIEDGA